MSHQRLVQRPKAIRSGFSFVAPKPALSGEPGERIAECVATQTQRRGNKWQVVLSFETDDGDTARMWIEVPEPLTATCRYMHLTRLALGREPRESEPVHPENVFRGKSFRVAVGWRKSQPDERGKQRFDEELAKHGPKDPSDFLRVHDLLERVDP